MEEAKMLLDKGGFFYPYQLDFRSRVYPKPAMLSPQSADYSRALLTFKFGKFTNVSYCFCTIICMVKHS